MAKKIFLALIIVLLYSLSLVVSLEVLSNVDYVGRGFNSQVGDPATNAIRYAVLHLSWNTNNIWKFNGKEYFIPDNFFATQTSSSPQPILSQVYTSSASVASGIYQTQTTGFSNYSILGMKPKYIPGMYYKSAQAEYFSKEVNQGRYTGFSYMEVQEWSVGISSVVTFNASYLDPYFLSWLTSLPSQFDYSTCSQFNDFIYLFGTHFLPKILFGGQVVMQSSFTESQYREKGENGVQKDLNNLFTLSTKKYCTIAEEEQFNALNAQYQSVTSLVGGDSSKYEPTVWPEWTATIPSNPIPLTMAIIPLSSLIPETDSRRPALDSAIQAYLRSGLEC